MGITAQALITKSKVVKLMNQHGIKGEVRGAGRNFEVELPNEFNKKKFGKHVAKLGGYKTGYGGWVLRPNYQPMGDWNDKSSRHHY